jgi:hypothetical protein
MRRTDSSHRHSNGSLTEELLARVVEVLETAPLPVDGGSWAVLELAQEVQRALEGAEPG